MKPLSHLELLNSQLALSLIYSIHEFQDNVTPPKNYYFFCCPLSTTLLSGSPIIQNGKLVGAVTHVLVNDPVKGYGIFIENMLEAMG